MMKIKCIRFTGAPNKPATSDMLLPYKSLFTNMLAVNYIFKHPADPEQHIVVLD